MRVAAAETLAELEDAVRGLTGQTGAGVLVGLEFFGRRATLGARAIGPAGPELRREHAGQQGGVRDQAMLVGLRRPLANRDHRFVGGSQRFLALPEGYP